MPDSFDKLPEELDTLHRAQLLAAERSLAGSQSGRLVMEMETDGDPLFRYTKMVEDGDIVEAKLRCSHPDLATPCSARLRRRSPKVKLHRPRPMRPLWEA